MTTTPNPTAEQILDEAMLAKFGRIYEGVTAEALRALRAHGLLSGGASSEEQIDRAGDAIFDLRMDYAGEDGLPSDRSMAIAALTAAARAAQGAAPPLPSSDVDEDKLAEREEK